MTPIVGVTQMKIMVKDMKKDGILLSQDLIQKGFNTEIIEDCLPGRTTNIDDPKDGIHLNGAKVLKSSLLSHSPIV